ncbi:TPA: protein-L-isoaspartate O-methyltransferase [Patescibacteria group bacterium]|nr:protein-L-isoaspartate O-methyltransferase [Patescibacteria group bacterium]
MNNMLNEYKKRREILVEEYLKGRGIVNPHLLDAFLEVPREEFVLEKHKEMAYLDMALPIGYGATISQPFVVAKMCESLEVNRNSIVLDIGTGSGYQAAILSRVTKKVVSIERVSKLVNSAKETIKKLGYENIKIVHGDGFEGYKEEAPYDAIISGARVRDIPKAWKEQIKSGGTIVYPEIMGGYEKIAITKRVEGGFKKSYSFGVVFVPLKKGVV